MSYVLWVYRSEKRIDVTIATQFLGRFLTGNVKGRLVQLPYSFFFCVDKESLNRFLKTV